MGVFQPFTTFNYGQRAVTPQQQGNALSRAWSTASSLFKRSTQTLQGRTGAAQDRLIDRVFSFGGRLFKQAKSNVFYVRPGATRPFTAAAEGLGTVVAAPITTVGKAIRQPLMLFIILGVVIVAVLFFGNRLLSRAST